MAGPQYGARADHKRILEPAPTGSTKKIAGNGDKTIWNLLKYQLTINIIILLIVMTKTVER